MSVLVPIRYPLREQSIRTLEYAAALASDRDTDVIVLHVNLFQSSGTASRDEIRRAVRPILDGSTPTVITRRGFLLEEIILDEASRKDVDYIVVGRNQAGKWRRLLSKLVGNTPDIAVFLRERTTADVHTVDPSRKYDGAQQSTDEYRPGAAPHRGQG